MKRKKIKRYWILGIIVSFVFFIIGAANAPGPQPQSAPFVSPKQQESEFKNSAQTVSIEGLVKSPKVYVVQPVVFTGVIGSFLVEGNGTEQGINLTDATDEAASLQVYLSEIDLANLVVGHSLTIWGEECGYVTEDNQSGANVIQQVIETEWYLKDNTSGYSSTAIQTAYLANNGVNAEISTNGLPGSDEGLIGLPGQPCIGVWVNIGTETTPVWQSETVGNYDTDALGKISQVSEADNPSKVDCLWNRVFNTLTFAIAPPNFANAVVIQYTAR
jgi:hypothetical protein